jgi:uncharacterized membrane protein
VLSVVRHLHFGSYGFDLGIADQIVWKYSQFKSPITTIQFFPFTSLLSDHVELIYILLSPFYWIFNSPITLLVLQAAFVGLSGIPVFWLARDKGARYSVSIAILISYFSFYGIQNAIWADVHSIVFGAMLLPWFSYYLIKGNRKLSFMFLLLAILCREDVALLTLLASLVIYIKNKSKLALQAMFLSTVYLFLIFAVYFPFFTQDGYRYANQNGMFSDLNLKYYVDSSEKINVYIYSLGWFGFLPLVSSLFLIPAFGDITRFFIFGNSITAGHSIFLHYRVTLAFLLAWPTIEVIRKYTKLNSRITASYLLLTALVCGYLLHSPLTYLSKKWFWNESETVSNINRVIKEIPRNSNIVAQNNIVPHISSRDNVFTLWPEKRKFENTEKCGEMVCHWFRWSGSPEYLIVDTSNDWDIRHFLANREDYLKSIEVFEKNKYIEKEVSYGNAVLYRITELAYNQD